MTWNATTQQARRDLPLRRSPDGAGAAGQRARPQRQVLAAARLAIAVVLLGAGAALGQLPPTLEDPGPTERVKSQRQREQIAVLARRHLGTPMRGGDLRDLDVLQRIVDESLIRRDDVASLQALGLSLGDVMERNLPLHWIVIDDELGRSRALRLRKTDYLFFPVTMISKRVANREPVRVRALYEQVAAEVERLNAQTRPKRRPLQRPPRPEPGMGGDDA